MRSAHRREVGLAVGLSCIAGYLDAVGFLELRGRFVSFMSGNTTELATQLGMGRFSGAGTVAALLGMFVVGAVIGAVAARIGDGRTTVLAVTTVLLAMTAFASLFVTPSTVITIGLPAAMGAMNSTFLSRGEVSIGLTYMTGTLVKAGQQLVEAFAGGPRFLWLRNLTLWLALAAGGLIGALSHRATGPTTATWIAVAVMVVITATTGVVRRRRGRPAIGHPGPSLRETPVMIGGSAGPEPVS
ncbi:YoaK family protein [Gordonia neofelifaecis]|uniref:DUF1275 domain-containing protein n=1 Tax=Gordonia neofelifaecis NRRL B-59395 TaxID=644548 RepID=F1YEF7_9ACTN|nr:YoaK family protein [Gordonia neofelifaecis]EGD56790.1 hypothetical protein SCNU_00390 [Gordonia neofelifaecis NRRL B-59395]